MSDYAVIGGTGTIGRLIVEELRATGASVRVLSRHSSDHPVDLSTGAGLDQGLRGCGVIVDAGNGSPRRPEPVLVDGCRRLVEAAGRAGARRIVCVSIVGIEHIPYRYYKAKLTQERIVQEGPVPSTIVRSTQFHELLGAVFAACARARISPSVRALLQPVAAAEAARAVAHAALEAEPAARVSVAGPEIADVGTFAEAWREHAGLRLHRVPLPLPRRLARPLRDGALTCAEPDVRAQTTFAAWLSAQS